jgi:hypothetical protein
MTRPMPYYWTRQKNNQPEERPKSHSWPNAFARKNSALNHARSYLRAVALYGERGIVYTARCYCDGKLIFEERSAVK